MPARKKIGTRDSELAVWQARRALEALKGSGLPAELKFIKSRGDVDLESPLHQMGGQGVFTYALNEALLRGEIDLAVHSMKDMPTTLPAGIRQYAVLPRGPVQDLLVFRQSADFLKAGDYKATIATGSLRRRAFWLERYPHHELTGLRGNVNTRLRKLNESDWDGAIFARAGLERINLRPKNSLELDWMLPAPAQGCIQLVGRADDEEIYLHCRQFNHKPTEICTTIERDFMRTLEGGCASPIGALASLNGDEIRFRGKLCAPDGSKSVEMQWKVASGEWKELGVRAARELLVKGGSGIMDRIRDAPE